MVSSINLLSAHRVVMEYEYAVFVQLISFSGITPEWVKSTKRQTTSGIIGTSSDKLDDLCVA